MQEEEYDFGQCCACGKEGRAVRNFVMVHKLAPVLGTGWGCVVCNLPCDGAMAVVCDKCIKRKSELNYALSGYPSGKQRVPYSSLRGEHNHDEKLHSDDELF